MRFHSSNPDPYGIMPIGARRFRRATIPEVVHFQTCHAAGPYSAVNCKVPPCVPVWQYVAKEERAAAERKCTAIAKATGGAA